MSSDEESPLERAVSRVGDRWALLVVHALLGGAKRFGELQELVPGIAPNVLSQRLKGLEREGVLFARPYCSRPPRFAYELTASGQELAGALRLLAQWGSAEGGEEGLHHDACGTAMEARWWCPTCARTVDDHEHGDADGGELRFV
jgi:DNA-binding HxlR family transcriptional regulator